MIALYHFHPYELQAFLCGWLTGAVIVGNAWYGHTQRKRRSRGRR